MNQYVRAAGPHNVIAQLRLEHWPYDDEQYGQAWVRASGVAGAVAPRPVAALFECLAEVLAYAEKDGQTL